MRGSKWGIALVAACLAAGGCTSARYVALTSGGGVVATRANSGGGREKALELIGQRCPRGYQIVREEEVPTGTVYRSDIRTEPNIFDGTDISQSSRSRTTTEWRITFSCD